MQLIYGAVTNQELQYTKLLTNVMGLNSRQDIHT